MSSVEEHAEPPPLHNYNLKLTVMLSVLSIMLSMIEKVGDLKINGKITV
jgi:hypothetical protein